MNIIEKIGLAVSNAESELPEGYEINVEIKRGKTTTALFIPSISDEDAGRVIHDHSGLNLAAKIRKALKTAKVHAGDMTNI